MVDLEVEGKGDIKVDIANVVLIMMMKMMTSKTWMMMSMMNKFQTTNVTCVT